MKGIGVILSFLFCISFALASIDIVQVNMTESYSPFEQISGEAQIDLSGESYNSILSSNMGDEILLGDFLKAHGFLDFCNPQDCSTRYLESSGEEIKSFSLGQNESSFLGFYLNGNKVEVGNLDFDISSDFGGSFLSPLKIIFFENSDWEFSEFSSNDFSRWDVELPSFSGSSELYENYRYCQEFEIPKTNLLRLGAYISGSGSVPLEMKVYTDSGDSLSCDLPNPSVENYCTVDAGIDWGFFEGTHYVCLEIPNENNYSLYTSEEGVNGGWAQSRSSSFSVPAEFLADFDLFVDVAKYANASVLSSIDWSSLDFDSDSLSDVANNFLSLKTGGTLDCSDGCVLPLEFLGVSQNLEIENILLRYTKQEGALPTSESKIYNLDATPAEISFSGLVDLSLTGFNISEFNKEKFVLYLDGEKLFEVPLEVYPAPILNDITPIQAPAGVPVTFSVGVSFNSNSSLTYKWDFGDGKTTTNKKNSVIHTYSNLGNYTLSVEVSAGGNLTSSKEQRITTISPASAVNATLFARNLQLNQSVRDINRLPIWYQEKINGLARIDYYRDELARLENNRQNAFSDQDYVDIATVLYSSDFKVPTSVFVSEESSFTFLTKLDDISPEIVQEFAGGSFDESNIESYKNAILRWQSESVSGISSRKVISMKTANNEESDLVSIYGFDFSSPDGENYFVIRKNYDDLYFDDSGVSARKVLDGAIVLVNEGQHSFEFYSEGSEEIPFFVSPKLSSLILEADIDTTCNYDNFCNEDAGENYRTCRNDCKPAGLMVFYIILVFLLVFIFYVVLQIWYNKKYEKHLFSDSKQLYNLLMFVSNARARGISDSEIRERLVKQGWAGERITFVLKKSRGERTGMYELFPITKISSWLRDRKAKKKIITGNQQQNMGNINKSSFPNSIR